jgi:hypothetical protein
MSALATKWNETCARLNVKPRQFGMLLGVTVVALGALGFKVLVHKPRSASAETKASAAKPATRGPGAAPAENGEEPVLPLVELPVMAVALESRPLRDPFVPFFLFVAPATGDEADAEDGPMAEASAPAAATPPRAGQRTAAGARGKTGPAKAALAEPAAPVGPQGVVLKAIIAGRVAVLNDGSVEVGDVVHDQTGAAFTVHDITERSIVLSDGHRTWPLGFTSKLSGKPGGGGKTPPPRR